MYRTFVIVGLIGFLSLSTAQVEVRPVSAVAGRGGSATLQCDVQGDLGQGRFQLEWHRNAKILPNDEVKYIIRQDNNSIEIMDVDFAQDLGEYVCVVLVENDQTYNATAYVYGKATVEQFEKSKNLVQDDALNLTCKASGYPVPTVTWSRDAHALNTTSERVTYAHYGQVQNASVKISGMQFEDAGEYVCEAVNSIEGVAYNATASITVRVKDKLAALWPFLGIVLEVTILCIIIFFYERHRNKKLAEEDAKEEADHLTNSHAKSDDVRQRKV